MTALLQRPLRAGLRRAKALIKANATVRNLLSDMDNQEEFGNLYEHEQMLADSVRVASYEKAIARHIRPGDVVLDLGTGTGILAFLAARRGAARVYAVDHSPFISVAERAARHNGIGNVVFVRANSRAYTPPEPIDVLLHEQIGDDLFDENMLENLLDLKRRALRAGGLILPERFELFLEPVSLRAEYRVPFLWDQDAGGFDWRFLRGDAEIARYMKRDHHRRYLRWGALEHFVCEPQPLLSVDMATLETTDELQREFVVERGAARDSAVDGLCLYFRIAFDAELGFDTSPARAPTHWGNRLFRVESRQVRQGERLRWRVHMKDLVDALTWDVALE